MINCTENKDILDWMLRPAFRVEQGIITRINTAAREYLLEEGTSIAPLLAADEDDYNAMEQGCLYLLLTVGQLPLHATVVRMDGYDLFLLDPKTADRELQVMQLASQTLRLPLNNLIAISEGLLPRALPTEDPKIMELLARMSRGLYQMQRILGNMADAGQPELAYRKETRNIPRVFDEIFEKAAALLELSNIQLQYQGLRKDIYGLIDHHLMERAVLNILSNSVKSMPQGGQIRAILIQHGQRLRLSIVDSGSGISQAIMGELFARYQRPPAPEDPQFGLGLGMLIIRAAAASHGGTVLVDQPGGSGTRVTLTMRIQENPVTQLNSMRTELSGGRDQALVELSQCLPVSAYLQELF